MENTSMTIAQFAARHCVSKPTVYRWLKDGRLSSIKIGHVRRVTKLQELNFLKRHGVQATNSYEQNVDPESGKKP